MLKKIVQYIQGEQKCDILRRNVLKYKLAIYGKVIYNNTRCCVSKNKLTHYLCDNEPSACAACKL